MTSPSSWELGPKEIGTPARTSSGVITTDEGRSTLRAHNPPDLLDERLQCHQCICQRLFSALVQRSPLGVDGLRPLSSS